MPLVVIFLVVRRWGVSLTRPVLKSVSSFVSMYGSLSYTPRAASCLVVKRFRDFSYTSSVGICLVVRLVGNLSYTPRASMSCLPFV